MSVTLSSLQPFAKRARRVRSGTRCELCAGDLGEAHAHVVDRSDRRLLCACGACVLVLAGGAHSRFRAVPPGVRLTDPPLTERDLDALGVPVGLAFFFRSSALERWIAVFPSPAGPTEAELREDVRRAAGEIADDVEALLVHRRRGASTSHAAHEPPTRTFIVPIDVAYELAGIVRRHWRGVDGGDDARRLVDAFFERLAERAQTRSP